MAGGRGASNGPMRQTFRVPGDAGAAPRRLDVVVTEGLAGWSRSRVQRAIKDGAVTVDGEAVRRAGTLVGSGAEVSIETEDGRETSTDTGGRRIVELRVLHEDDAIAVIDKQAGLVTHPNPRQVAGTVSDLAVARFGPLPEVQGENRPGIVHRLDRMTSGVLVLGKTEEALLSLKRQFKERTVAKTYLAIVHGTPRFDEEWLTGAIAPSVKNPDRMRVLHARRADEDDGEGHADPRAREAETFLQRTEDFGPASLVRASPKTGRTHQIRVHLQAAGLPIVGDRTYGPRGALRVPMPKGAPAMERPALHARRLEIDHPVSGERLAFEAELPADMTQLLEFLRGR